MVKNGRPAAPRALQVRFWDGVRSGLRVTEARLAAGVGNEMAFRWFKDAGGVTSNGARPVSGRYLSVAEREEIAVGLAGRGVGAGDRGPAAAQSAGGEPGGAAERVPGGVPGTPAMARRHQWLLSLPGLPANSALGRGCGSFGALTSREPHPLSNAAVGRAANGTTLMLRLAARLREADDDPLG